ncbi:MULTISPECIES: hypothetical protein [Streptomyces]|uniref:Lsr2 protein n=1 Tax=Streptomyces lonegramiae TaxID=3075524 RepID=A0ABU2XPX4_9ACTN|nr:hypothetical protein [Streptomyces sp. DSM 41529]MDT0547986.1 hypothetical protein [Streptomyces sp. DSM 41529]
MEQRIGPSTPPVPAAGFDPAYIPGLTAPRPAEEEPPKEKAEKAEEPLEDAETEAGTEADAEPEAEAEADAEAEAEAEAADAAEETAGEDEDEDGGPVFEAADHRGSIVARRGGVTLRLDGETAEFDWSEIGAVEIDTPRFGRRFSVTVYTTARRWYTADVAASSKKVLKEWTTELDAVLDAYFEDAKPEKAEPEKAEPEDAKPEKAEPEDTKPEKAEPEDAKS